MKDKYFLDTNIIVYLFDNTSKRKSSIANKILRNIYSTNNGCISYQVIQEFLNFSIKKFKKKLSKEDLIEFIQVVLEELIEVYPTSELFIEAIDIKDRWKYSFYDSLIIASALKANCNILYSEDLQHGQDIRDMKIINPFLKEINS